MDISLLESQVLALSAKDRAALANRLLDSLESMDDSEFEELWGRESLDRIERSESKSISGEEVATKARALLRCGWLRQKHAWQNTYRSSREAAC